MPLKNAYFQGYVTITPTPTLSYKEGHSYAHANEMEGEDWVVRARGDLRFTVRMSNLNLIQLKSVYAWAVWHASVFLV